MAGVDDGGLGGGRAVRRGADQQVRDRLDRVLRGRQADAGQLVAAQGRQALQRQRQMGAALVRRHGVDLVDDHRPRGRQHRAAGLGAEQDVERFRGRDDDVRRAARMRWRSLGGVSPVRTQVRISMSGRPRRAEFVADAGERRLQVVLDVVGQGLQGRDVDHLCRVGQPVGQALAHQRIDRRQEGRQGLARAGRGGDQRVAARLDRRPSLRLRRRGRGEAAREPGRDGGVKQGDWVHGDEIDRIRGRAAGKSICAAPFCQADRWCEIGPWRVPTAANARSLVARKIPQARERGGLVRLFDRRSVRVARGGSSRSICGASKQHGSALRLVVAVACSRHRA